MMHALLFGVVLALAYANGANDNIKPFATVYGSGVLPYKRALAFATGAQLAGSAMSILVAGALIKAFSGKGFVPDEATATTGFLMAVGLGAVVAVGLATRLGIPISTTHSLVGGLAGAGLAFAPAELSWMTLGAVFALPLVLSPALAMVLVAALYPIMTKVRKVWGIEATTRVVATPKIGLAVMQADGSAAAIQQGVSIGLEDSETAHSGQSSNLFGADAQRVADVLHLGSAMALGFARGLNDTPKILGVLLAAHVAGGLNTTFTLLLVGGAMALGGVLHSRRIAHTLGRKITSINRGQGLLANCVSSLLVILASFAGMPVSTTHVSSGAIFGIGVWTGDADWALVRTILLAWVVTLPVAAITAYTLGQSLVLFG